MRCPAGRCVCVCAYVLCGFDGVTCEQTGLALPRSHEPSKANAAGTDTHSPFPFTHSHTHTTQYTNLLFQSSQLGLTGQWAQVKKAYAAANRLLGDIIKVSTICFVCVCACVESCDGGGGGGGSLLTLFFSCPSSFSPQVTPSSKVVGDLAQVSCMRTPTTHKQTHTHTHTHICSCKSQTLSETHRLNPLPPLSHTHI